MRVDQLLIWMKFKSKSTFCNFLVKIFISNFLLPFVFRGLSHLEIQKVNQKDTGYYECRAMNVVAQEPAIGKVRVIVTIFNSFENKIKSTTTSSPATFNPLQGRPCPMASFCLNGATCTMESTYGEYVCQ